MNFDWQNLNKKKYDKYGNEIDDNGNIVTPAGQAPMRPQGPTTEAEGYTPDQPQDTGSGGNYLSNFVGQAAPDIQSKGGNGVMSGAGTGASLGATLGSVIPGVGNVVGTAAGAVIGAIGGGINAKGEEDKAAEANKQMRADEQARQQRLDQMANEARYRGDQSVGRGGIDWLSQQADLAQSNARGGIRRVMARALGY
jgi:hypothetical protein